jgi:hypothetical protein
LARGSFTPFLAAFFAAFSASIASIFFLFSKAFLRASGIGAYLENPISYKKNLAKGKRLGKPGGVSTGYRWVANAGVSRIG